MATRSAGLGGMVVSPTASGYQKQADLATRRMGQMGMETAGISRELMGEYRGTYRPLQGQVIREAQRYPDVAEQTASLDTTMAYDKARQAGEVQMSRMGISPISGRFAGLKQEWELARAAAEAGAKTRARRQSAQDRFQRLARLAEMGMGLPTNASNMFGQAAGTFGAQQGIYGGTAGDAARADVMAGDDPEVVEAMGGSAAPERLTAAYEVQDSTANLPGVQTAPVAPASTGTVQSQAASGQGALPRPQSGWTDMSPKQYTGRQGVWVSGGSGLRSGYRGKPGVRFNR